MLGGRAWRIGRVLGVELRIHGSWAFVALLVAYSFSVQFAGTFDLTPATNIPLAVGAAVLFFVSVLVHELAHAVVARARGIEVHNITLFFFGGATHARVDSRGPADEFITSAVGPLTSFLIAGVLGAIAILGRGPLPDPVAGALGLLAWLNLLLAVFNLLPGFPLDGGRLLRSAIWRKTGSLARATRIAGLWGQGLGYVLVVGGLLLAFTGRVGGGLWIALIGWFLSQAARASFEELRRTRLLKGVAAREVMTTDVEGATATLSDASPRDRPPTVSPATPMLEVMASLEREGVRRVLVVSDHEVVGVITLGGVSRWLKRRQAAGA